MSDGQVREGAVLFSVDMVHFHTYSLAPCAFEYSQNNSSHKIETFLQSFL